MEWAPWCKSINQLINRQFACLTSTTPHFAKHRRKKGIHSVWQSPISDDQKRSNPRKIHGSGVGLFARVDPLVVDVDGLHEVVDGALVAFRANGAAHRPRVPFPVQFHLAWSLVVTEGTVEHGGQGFNVLALGGRLSLGFSLSHVGACGDQKHLSFFCFNGYFFLLQWVFFLL